MKLAAIDIGTNSIHTILVEAERKRSFNIIEREKEMAKLGVGVFANNKLKDEAFNTGIETISRYVQLAEKMGVDEIITAATSAIREARNGEDFLDEIVERTGVSPRIISGKEEARLIFLAVRNSIALENDDVLVFDIGGGSTEVVVGNREEILFRDSMKLGVLRLLDMFADKDSVGKEARGVLEAHIQFLAQKTLEKARKFDFKRVIGTSGTIRTLGEAAYMAAEGESMRSVNAETVRLKDIEQLTEKLLNLNREKRTEVDGISEKRADAIHLGGILLVQLLKMAEVEEITLCDASLREGMILDYLERHSQQVPTFATFPNLRSRKVAQIAHKYESDWQQKSHVSSLALQIFDRTKELHQYGDFERELLQYAALLCDIGQYISFRKHHKHSRYLIRKINPRGFTDEEILLLGHIARYHRKAEPTKKHKKFKKLAKSQRHQVKILAGILRIADALDKTKNQLVDRVSCQISEEKLTILVSGADNLELELWAARRESKVLAKALKRKIEIKQASLSEIE